MFNKDKDLVANGPVKKVVEPASKRILKNYCIPTIPDESTIKKK